MHKIAFAMQDIEKKANKSSKKIDTRSIYAEFNSINNSKSLLKTACTRAKTRLSRMSRAMIGSRERQTFDTYVDGRQRQRPTSR